MADAHLAGHRRKRKGLTRPEASLALRPRPQRGSGRPPACAAFEMRGSDILGVGEHRKETRHVSTNPDEDLVYLEKPDTAFLTKAEITRWEEGRTFSSDWAGNHFFS